MMWDALRLADRVAVHFGWDFTQRRAPLPKDLSLPGWFAGSQARLLDLANQHAKDSQEVQRILALLK